MNRRLFSSTVSSRSLAITAAAANPAVSKIHSLIPSSAAANLLKNTTQDVRKNQQNIQLSINALMQAGLHLGHSSKIWHKNMLPFIYGRRSGLHIINLEHTLVYLRRAMNVTREIASRGGIVLFVHTSHNQQQTQQQHGIHQLLSDCARRSQQFYYCNQPWVSGRLENARQHHTQMQQQLPQHSQSILNRWMPFPDLMICLDMQESKPAIEEATRLRIPTIGLSDTDCDPMLVTYPIPGNDDSPAAVELVARLLSEAAREGRQLRDTQFTLQFVRNR